MSGKKNKYEIIQKYFFRDFKIEIGFYIKNSEKHLTASIRNKKWKKTNFLMLTDEDEKNLRNKVSLFLKNPDLREKNIYKLGIVVFRTQDQKTKIEDERKSKSVETISRLEDRFYKDWGIDPEDIYEQELREMALLESTKEYSSIDDAHSLEWNVEDEEWSNDDDYR